YYQNRPRKSVVYSHSHVDHAGGVRGVVDEADVKSGKVKIFAPEGFLENFVAENLFAGTAMGRRASYMYGNLVTPGPQGTVTAGLSVTTSSGTVTLIAPTDLITRTGEKPVIDAARRPTSPPFLAARLLGPPSLRLASVVRQRPLPLRRDVVPT